jgi:hypothetical protein
LKGYWERYFSKYNKGTVLVGGDGGGGGNYDNNNNNNNSKVVFKTHPQEKGRSSKTHIHTLKKKRPSQKKKKKKGLAMVLSAWLLVGLLLLPKAARE